MTQYKLVPVEPTEEMLLAMVKAWEKRPYLKHRPISHYAYADYKAALAAAPEVKQEPEVDGWPLYSCIPPATEVKQEPHCWLNTNDDLRFTAPAEDNKQTWTALYAHPSPDSLTTAHEQGRREGIEWAAHQAELAAKLYRQTYDGPGEPFGAPPLEQFAAAIRAEIKGAK